MIMLGRRCLRTDHGGYLDYTPALNSNLNVDDTGNTFAGTINGKFRVYIDPYAANLSAANAASNGGNQYYVVGYKGSSPYDAGLFYCPYVPPDGSRRWRGHLPTQN